MVAGNNKGHLFGTGAALDGSHLSFGNVYLVLQERP